MLRVSRCKMKGFLCFKNKNANNDANPIGTCEEITHVKKSILGADVSRERTFRRFLQMLPGANFQGKSTGVML